METEWVVDQLASVFPEPTPDLQLASGVAFQPLDEESS